MALGGSLVPTYVVAQIGCQRMAVALESFHEDTFSLEGERAEEGDGVLGHEAWISWEDEDERGLGARVRLITGRC